MTAPNFVTEPALMTSKSSPSSAPLRDDTATNIVRYTSIYAKRRIRANGSSDYIPRMSIQSLGYRTDLFFSKISGHVTDHGDYLCIRTPSNPTYWWGNYVLFKRAPRLEDAQVWLETFRCEHPDAKHVAIGYDSFEPGDVSGFGLNLVTSDVMTARALHEPPHPNCDADIRILKSDTDWNARLELSKAVQSWGHEFLERSNKARRRQVEAGHGVWFGAFLDGKLVSSLGVFDVGDGLARFQTVETHPAFERRGLCGTLVHHAGKYALEHLGANTLVMVADPEYHAKRIYESVGFEVVQTQYALEKSDTSA
jgi:RimJ/RimL family protein N-acetyltransferase